MSACCLQGIDRRPSDGGLCLVITFFEGRVPGSSGAFLKGALTSSEVPTALVRCLGSGAAYLEESSSQSFRVGAFAWCVATIGCVKGSSRRTPLSRMGSLNGSFGVSKKNVSGNISLTVSLKADAPCTPGSAGTTKDGRTKRRAISPTHNFGLSNLHRWLDLKGPLQALQ